jgi:hypothetical protein
MMPKWASLVALGLALLAGWMVPCSTSAYAQEASPDSAPAVRPAIRANRWQEDWSPLADPALRTNPMDGLKYIPLSPNDVLTYMSLGLTLRERYESVNAPSFGIGPNRRDSYLLQRLWIHADVHFNSDFRVFTELESALAPGKGTITPVDQNPLDVRLAFLEYTHRFSQGTLKARIGRQEFAFDLQRFVSLRDGPNVRQAFDAVWIDWETGPWRFIGFVSQPVQYNPQGVFNDSSGPSFRFHTLRVERHVLGDNELSAYYSRYERENATFLDASGAEHRNVFDVRFAGASVGFDWDLEAMGQTGNVGNKNIRAWALGSRVGYTFSNIPLRPRLGLQADAASGDRRRGDGTLGTFNPLFPNGYYFTLAGFTGYTNLIHLKPSLTITPASNLTLTAAVGLQWRQTTADAIYVQPNIPLAGTAGRPGRWSGAYGQIRADWAITPNLSAAVEAVHYQIGDAIRRAGGRNGDYLGVQLTFAW